MDAPVERGMDDLTSTILMAVVLLAVVLRSCWRGNPVPGFAVAAAGVLFAIVAAIRHLQQSDIILPLIVAALAGTISLVAHKVRSNESRQD
jgi:hypothetical protein